MSASRVRALAALALATAATTVGVGVDAAAPLPGAAVRVSPAAGTQNEPTIGVDPANPDVLVAGSIADSQCGVYASSDRGLTWSNAILPVSSDAAFTNAGDPVVEFAADGTAYFLCMNTANSNAQKSQYVYRSIDGGATWTTPVIAIAPTFGNDDKGHIVADNHPGSPHFGNVYVAATALGSGSLRFARSTDGAQSFGPPQTINDSNIGFAVNLAVGADGAVYAAWSREATVGVSNAVLIDRSDDGGVTFGALSGGTDHIIQGTGIVLGGVRAEPNRGNGFPYIGTHPSNPDLVYAVWAEDAPGADDSDIRFSRSVDRGNTWSASVRLNVDVNPPGDFASQFWPTMAVDPIDGEIDVIWYSDANDPDRTDGTPLVDVYFTSSDDNGVTFSTPVRVTRSSSRPAGFFGDYLGIDALGGVAHAIWTDTTITPGNQDVATTQIGGADLVIDKSDDLDPAIAGSTLTYELTVHNAGPADARDVTIIDHLPTGTTLVSAPAGCTTSPGAVECTLGRIPAGTTSITTFDVAVDPALVHDAGAEVTLTNIAQVSSSQPDPDTTNNIVVESTAIHAVTDLSVTALTATGPTEMVVAETGTYDVTISIANAGPSTPVDTGIDVVTSTSSGLTVVPASRKLVLGDVDSGAPRSTTTSFDVTCAQPGTHALTFEATAVPLDPATTDPNAANDTATMTATITCAVPVAINVKPGSVDNPINLASNGVIPVAVLTTHAGEYGLPLAVDATSIDVASLRAGPPSVLIAGGGAEEAHARAHTEDTFELDEVTRDGDNDVILHFRTRSTGLQPDDTELCVRGTITSGSNTFTFIGCDDITTVPTS